MIIRKTLSLLNELSISFNCVRKLVKLEEIQFILNNHTSEHFSFLGTNVAVSEMRFRSLFYTSLGRLLMVDLGEDEERFYNCLQPLTSEWSCVGGVGVLCVFLTGCGRCGLRRCIRVDRHDADG